MAAQHYLGTIDIKKWTISIHDFVAVTANFNVTPDRRSKSDPHLRVWRLCEQHDVDPGAVSGDLGIEEARSIDSVDRP
jgi:hypothetical protein